MERKKILIVSDCPSNPLTAGNRTCIRKNADILQKMGYDVYFLLVNNGSMTDEDISEMKFAWKEKLFLFRTNKIQVFLQKLHSKLCITLGINYQSLDLYCPWFIPKFVKHLVSAKGIDTIMVNYIWMSKLLEKSSVKHKLIYTHDVFSYKLFKGEYSWFSYSPNKEAIALNRATDILAIQENEAIYYKYLAPKTNVKTVFMPFKYIETPIVRNQVLLFFSGGNVHNLNGIKLFIKHIFPILHKEFPNVKLYIGGSICKVLKQDCLDGSIKLLGGFHDPYDFYKLGDIAINPVFSGTGLKVKTFEAISYGKYVLAHTHSLEGVYDPSNIPVKECVDAKDYISCLRELFDGGITMDVIKMHTKNYLESLDSYIESSYKQIIEKS